MKTKLLLISNHIKYHETLINQLLKYDIEVIKQKGSLNDAELITANLQPELIIIDTNHLNKTFVTQFLDDVSRFSYLPNIFIISSYDDYYTNDFLDNYEIQATILFPYLSKELSRYLATYSKINHSNIKSCKDNLINNISEKLKLCGLNSGMNSFWYIRYGIYKSCLYENTKASLSKTIYPDIAKKFQCSTSSVEWTIRHAIKIHHNQILNVLFNDSSNKQSEFKLTSTIFLRTLSDIISSENSYAIQMLKDYECIKDNYNYVIE